MTIFNLGSINADLFYRLPHLPAPGETLAATSHFSGLGGKGANQSVAAARAGADVVHIGAVGRDGAWMVDRLRQSGVDVAHICEIDGASGHAVIYVDVDGENVIVLHPGANRCIPLQSVEAALSQAGSKDWLMLQNETNGLAEAAQIARGMGLRVAYSAAPFDAEITEQMLPLIDLLILNEIEAAQLSDALGVALDDVSVPRMVVTAGPKGAVWRAPGEPPLNVPAFDVTPVDTTGAGDTFAGYLIASLAEGMNVPAAMQRANAAAALMVQRKGTADAIPLRQHVLDFQRQ